MSTLQEQARALGDPSRHEIFRHIAAADGPVDVATLTAHLGLNHNAIRQHLAKLVAAGLLVESTAPATGRGRPRLRYVVDPGADGRWGVSGPYERLSVWLAEVLRSGESPVEVGRRVGRSRTGTPSPADDPAAQLADEMARHGFEPVLERDGDRVDVVLQNCPFVTTVLADRETVCDLHLGLAEGVAASIGGLVVEELVANDPRRAQCRLRCHLEVDRSVV